MVIIPAEDENLSPKTWATSKDKVAAIAVFIVVLSNVLFIMIPNCKTYFYIFKYFNLIFALMIVGISYNTQILT